MPKMQKTTPMYIIEVLDAANSISINILKNAFFQPLTENPYISCGENFILLTPQKGPL